MLLFNLIVFSICFFSSISGMVSQTVHGIDSAELLDKRETIEYCPQASKRFDQFCIDLKKGLSAAVTDETVAKRFPFSKDDVSDRSVQKMWLMDKFGALMIFGYQTNDLRAFFNTVYDTVWNMQISEGIPTYVDYFRDRFPKSTCMSISDDLYRAFFRRVAVEYFITQHAPFSGQPFLNWCNCEKMPVWDRLNSITYLYFCLLEKKMSCPKDDFEYVSFGSGQLLHDYLLCFAMGCAGYKKIKLHAIDNIYTKQEYKEYFLKLFAYSQFAYSDQKDTTVDLALHDNINALDLDGKVDLINTTDTSDLTPAPIEQSSCFRVELQSESSEIFRLDCRYKGYAAGYVSKWASSSTKRLPPELVVMRAQLVQCFANLNQARLDRPVPGEEYFSAANDVVHKWLEQPLNYIIREAKCKEAPKKYFKELIKRLADNNSLISTNQMCRAKIYSKK